MTTKLTLSLLLFASIASPAIAATAATPDFGPNVLVFNSSMPPATIQAQIDKVYATQRRNEFCAIVIWKHNFLRLYFFVRHARVESVLWKAR